MKGMRIAALAVLGLCPLAASGAMIELGPAILEIDWSNAREDTDSVVDLVTTVVENPNGSFLITGSGRAADHAWRMDWTMVVDPDPFIFATFNVTNNLGVSQDLNINAMLPITPPLAAPTDISGSISGSVLDSSGDGNGAIMTNAAGDPSLYEARIDGAAVRTLADTFAFTAPAFLTDPWDGGDFVNEAGPAANTSIEIDHNFNITAGDSVTFTSSFLVVPEPTSVALVALGGFAMLRRRR